LEGVHLFNSLEDEYRLVHAIVVLLEAILDC